MALLATRNDRCSALGRIYFRLALQTHLTFTCTPVPQRWAKLSSQRSLLNQLCPTASFDQHITKMGSVVLPHLVTAWHVDQAIMSEDERLVVIRFGRDWDPDCMRQDEVLYRIADRVKNFAVRQS